MQRLGRRSLAIQADISQKIDVENLVQRATDEFGAIDILVNNAAIYLEVPMLECREEVWDKYVCKVVGTPSDKDPSKRCSDDCGSVVVPC